MRENKLKLNDKKPVRFSTPHLTLLNRFQRLLLLLLLMMMMMMMMMLNARCMEKVKEHGFPLDSEVTVKQQNMKIC